MDQSLQDSVRVPTIEQLFAAMSAAMIGDYDFDFDNESTAPVAKPKIEKVQAEEPKATPTLVVEDVPTFPAPPPKMAPPPVMPNFSKRNGVVRPTSYREQMPYHSERVSLPAKFTPQKIIELLNQSTKSDHALESHARWIRDTIRRDDRFTASERIGLSVCVDQEKNEILKRMIELTTLFSTEPPPSRPCIPPPSTRNAEKPVVIGPPLTATEMKNYLGWNDADEPVAKVTKKTPKKVKTEESPEQKAEREALRAQRHAEALAKDAAEKAARDAKVDLTACAMPNIAQKTKKDEKNNQKNKKKSR